MSKNPWSDIGQAVHAFVINTGVKILGSKWVLVGINTCFKLEIFFARDFPQKNMRMTL